MPNNDWIREKLIAYGYNTSPVYSMFEEYRRLFNYDRGEDSYKRQVRRINAQLIDANVVRPSTDNSFDGQDRYQETIEILPDGKYKSDKLLLMSSEQCKDVEYMLSAHGFDSGFWSLVSARNNIWNVYSKTDGVQQLYSSKITVKPAIPDFTEDWIRDTINSIDFKSIEASFYDYTESSKVVEINFADVHLGKFISELVSNSVYNTDLAIERYEASIDNAINKLNPFTIGKIIFPVGQDYLNIDNFEGTTTKGTRQDMNDFYEELYRKAFACLIRTVEKLRSVAPVSVIYVKGNHDKQSTFSMVCGLEQIYANIPGSNVTVDTATLQRKYITFGDILLGLGHGEEEKNRIFDCMQVDAGDNWHKKRKYFHLSHKHRESKVEKAGVIYQWLGSLSENCSWTWKSGFVGSEKKGHVFIYDEASGLEAEFFIKV